MKINKEKLHVHTSILVFTEYKEKLYKVNNTHLKLAVDNLLNNIERIENIGVLPLLLVQNTSSESDFYRRFHTAIISLCNDRPTKTQIEQEMEKLKGELDMSSIESALDILNDIIDDDPKIKSSFENLFLLKTVFLWTLFEAVSCDLWVLCINKVPHSIGKSALFNKKDRIVNHIFNQFIENDFKIDLKEQLGDFLVSYYDFSGVRDIRKSFKVLFGKTFEEISKYLEQNIYLNNLQHIRNQIVHKAGIVDQMFLDLTKLPDEIGKELLINGELYKKYAHTSIDACVKLIEFINEFLNRNNL